MRLIKETLWCLILLALLIIVVVGGLWLRNNSALLGSILGNVNAASFNLKTATWNASDAAWQADEAAADSRPILHATLIHADQAMGETSRTMQHVAHVTQDIGQEQLEYNAAGMIVFGKAATLLETANDTVDKDGEQLRYTLSELEETEKSAKGTIDDFDRNLVNNPDLAGSFKNFNRVSLDAAAFMDDTTAKWHQTLYPAPYRGRLKKLHTMLNVARALGTAAQIGVPPSEFLYYLSNINASNPRK